MQKQNLYLTFVATGTALVMAYAATMILDLLDKHIRAAFALVGFALMAVGQWKLYKLNKSR